METVGVSGLNPLGRITLSFSRAERPPGYLRQVTRSWSSEVSYPVQQLEFTEEEVKTQRNLSIVTCQVNLRSRRRLIYLSLI